MIQNPTHRLPAIMSLRDSLSVKFKQTILGIGALRIFNLNFQLLRLRFMRTHARERRPNPGMLAKINRALARHAPWFPNFLLSPISSFPPLPRYNPNQLTTDSTDTIWIKFKRRMSWFPNFLLSRFRLFPPSLRSFNLNFQPQLALRLSSVDCRCSCWLV